MNNLGIAKAIAELEGVNVDLYNGELCLFEKDGVLGPEVPVGYFNPITDLALNCMLRDKYGVCVSYADFKYICVDDATQKVGYTEFESKEDIPRAVCECILKSQGRYLNEQ